MSPLGHAQVPAWHVSPTSEHVMPQVPQLYTSVCLFTHAVPHTLSPLGH